MKEEAMTKRRKGMNKENNRPRSIKRTFLVTPDRSMASVLGSALSAMEIPDGYYFVAADRNRNGKCTITFERGQEDDKGE